MTHSKDSQMVLVADDDITVRILAEECLQEMGFSVVTVENGREAIDVCNAQKPDLVVLDVLMPGLGGLEACREIRKVKGNEYLPILMMTALDDSESVNTAFQAGASEYTTKPVNWHVEGHRLRNMISSACSSRELELKRREWERTFDAVDDIIIVLDLDLRIVQMNAAALRMLPDPSISVIGKKCCEIHGCGAEVCRACPLMKSLSTGKRQQAKRFDGCRKGNFLVSAHPVADEHGIISRMVYMAKDVTVQERLRDEVMRSKKLSALGTLSGGMAHDFNNLLQVILGNTDIAMLDLSENADAYDCLNEIRNAANRGRELIGQLMIAAKGGQDDSRVLLSMNDMVNELIALIHRTFPSDVELNAEMDPGLDLVRVNKAQMEQVIMNIVINARHAMPSGGCVTFKTSNLLYDEFNVEEVPGLKPGSYVCLSIIDTGHGMDEETQERVFEPFFTTREPGSGSGLGLASAYGIVQRHEGALLCESAVGKGTEFSIYLPVCSEIEGVSN